MNTITFELTATSTPLTVGGIIALFAGVLLALSARLVESYRPSVALFLVGVITAFVGCLAFVCGLAGPDQSAEVRQEILDQTGIAVSNSETGWAAGLQDIAEGNDTTLLGSGTNGAPTLYAVSVEKDGNSYTITIEPGTGLED